MTMRATWDRPATGSDRPVAPPERESPRWWAAVSWEELLTLSLILVAMLAVVMSVERADWVNEMPRLAVVALVGLGSGWALGRTRAPVWALHLAGVTIGLFVVFGMVMHTMQLTDPTVDSGIDARWSELWDRVGAWLNAFRTSDVSTDPLPFVLMVVFAAWALAYIAAWAVVRWRNPWLALIPGGIALLTNISYLPGQPSLEFIVFLFAAILLFARLHLLRTVERWQGERASAPPLLSLEVLNLATWVGVGLIIVAWVVPTANNWGPVADAWERALSPVNERFDRFGRLFVGVGSKSSIGFHKFDNVLPLQGNITLDSNTLFEVRSEEALYLRGATYDEYTSNGWKLTDSEERPLPGLTIEAAQFGTDETQAQFRRPVQVQVQVTEAVGKHRLLTFGEPLASDRDSELLTGPAPEDTTGLAASRSLGGGDGYTTVGTISAATVDRLITSSPDYPDWVRERYLQLPKDLPPEIAQLADEIAGEERVPYVIAAKVEQYLRANYRYDFDIGTRPPRRDAVAYFLFDAQRGYFDYHASAMAVLLRTLGIPARVAVGFALDELDRDEDTGVLRVSEQRSWSWTEVFFPGYGWVEFNPTPGRPALARAGDDSQFEPLPGAAGSIDPGVDGLLGDELFIPSPGSPDAPGFEGTGAPLDEQSGSSRGWLLWPLAAAAVIVVGAGAGRFGWEAAFRGLPPASRRWAKMQTLAGWAGIPAREERTPHETAAALSATIRPRIDVQPIARAYVAERYSGSRRTEDAEEAKRLDALYVRARGRLLKRSVRRLFGLEREVR